MRQVHLILQGKGGVGKSFVASLLVQHITAKGRPVIAIDTDPVNATLTGYRAFLTQRIELLENGAINERVFDSLMERLVAEDADFVVDNGATTFIPLSFYLNENDAVSLIGNHGKQVVVHTVITGGQALTDTMLGFVSLATQMPPETRIVVWLNEFFGDISVEGRGFEQSKAYLAHKDRVHAIVRIARRTGNTFERDVQLMLDRKLTFAEVMQSEEFGLMARSRLFHVSNDLFSQLALAV